MKRAAPTIIGCIRSAEVFGQLPAFQDLSTWASWIVWLKAAFALSMDPAEIELYRQCTGRKNPPTTEPREVITLCGRRGGKSFISGLTAVFLACFGNYQKYLNRGEVGAVLILARDRQQARVVWKYICGILESVPALRSLIVARRADEIELLNQVTLMVKTADYRGLRGFTVVAAVCDEVSFWSSEDSANPDREIFTALRPAMASIPTAKLLAISTPYARSGVMFEAHKENFGVDGSSSLVWVAPTTTMNPIIDRDLIKREIERDPEAGRAEWLAEFREDLEAAFSLESIEACVIRGRDELPASRAIAYRAFVDVSGGKKDSFTCAVGHAEGGKVVVDALKIWPAPFDPSAIVFECAKVLRSYGCVSVVGDLFGGSWPASMFKIHGISYEPSPKAKSDLYLNLIPVVNAGSIELLDSKELINELRRLERRRGKTGRDFIDHPSNGRDDAANSVAGVSYLLLQDERPDSVNARRLLVAGAFG